MKFNVILIGANSRWRPGRMFAVVHCQSPSREGGEQGVVIFVVAVLHAVLQKHGQA
ncbi:MAG: hypothetical protein ACK41Q_10350 [Candidatus Brocadia sp.]